MIRIVVVYFSLALIGGCVTAYVPPSGSDTASLTIETVDPVSRNIGFVHYRGGLDGYRCSAAPAVGLAILHNVSIGGGKYVSSVTVKIPAGAPFRLSTQMPFITQVDLPTVHSTLCQAQIRFTPLRGAKYVAVHGIGGDFCKMSLFSVDSAGTGTPVPYEKLPVCFDPKLDGGAWRRPIKEEFERNPSAYREMPP